jgi:hypothetical protein
MLLLDEHCRRDDLHADTDSGLLVVTDLPAEVNHVSGDHGTASPAIRIAILFSIGVPSI